MGTSETLAFFVLGALTSGTHGFALRKKLIVVRTASIGSTIRVSISSAKYKLSTRSMALVASSGVCSTREVNKSGPVREHRGKCNFNLLGYGNVVRGCGGASQVFSIYAFGIRDRGNGKDHFSFHLPGKVVHGSFIIYLVDYVFNSL